ncbi:MAG: signal peptidase I [Spirochaetaceae bacterium]|nr:signal peptidase I [Spirochaetaceae bacterium]
MEKFLTKLENKTVSYLTHRKQLKIYEKNNKPSRTFLGELKGWVDALVFAIIVILIINQFLFQLYIIPSPSMEKTLLVKDRVFVNKNIFGLEPYPGGTKLGTKNRRVHRDNIITFYNPEYVSKGPVFDILAQVLFMGTLSLVKIDRNKDGSIAERLLVKRAGAMNGDTVKFVNGNVLIRSAGTSSFVPESTFRVNNNLSSGPNRLIENTYYEGMNAWAALYAYQEKGIKTDAQIPQYLKSEYTSLTEKNYPKDGYGFKTIENNIQHKINPTDFNSRSNNAIYQNGITVPDGYVLPLGDNRDNSNDGRYFGPVPQGSVTGQVLFRFWPLNRIGYLGNK